MPKNEKKISVSPYYLWYLYQYKEKYLQFPTSDKIKEYFKKKENDYWYLYGSFNRINAMVVFGYFLDIDVVDTICTTFKIRDTIENIESIYSFGYYENINKKIKKNTTFIPHGSKYTYKYFTMGGSFLSKDGEYRVGFIKISNLRAIEGNPKVNNLYESIKLYLVKKLIDRKMMLFKEFFYPSGDRKEIEIELEYYSYELQSGLFALTWFNDMYNKYLNIVENHINKKYQNIMFKHKKEDLEYIEILIKRHGIDVLDTLRYFSNHIFNNTDIKITNEQIGTKIGQKIIPLSIAEAQNPFELSYKPWREYLISVYLSNLVINNVSCGFFITNSWFYIKNSRKGLFDNEIQYDKMSRSELAIQITELLNRAQLYTYENIDKHKMNNKITKNQIDSWISNKFKHLSDKIQKPIDYAKEDIIMSNVALCMITEYVGRTIMDVISLSKISPYYNKLIGYPFTQMGYVYFSKYMFEICYNLYCMNYLGGIIHGDLHLNNATLKPLTYKNNRNVLDIDNPQVLYVLGDETDQYLFNTCGYYTCMIDFSRSIVLPEKIEQLHDTSLPKSHNILKNIKKYQEYQIESLLNLYIHFTSDINKDELRILFKNHFEAVFKLLSVTDIFGFTQKLLTMFSLKDKHIVTPYVKCIDLLNKINKYAEQYLTVEMNKLILDKYYEKTILSMDWPIHTIIQNCFCDFLISNTKLGTIVDVYNINNELKYSLNKADNYPSAIADAKQIINGKIAPSKVDKNILANRKIFEAKKTTGMKMVNYIAVRQKQKYI
jgi:hypothetical protein